MKFLSSLLLILLLSGGSMPAQVSISSGSGSPDNSAMLDVSSNHSGLLIPRMTADQIAAILTPANGLQVFCTTDNRLYMFTGTVWKDVAFGTATILPFPCGTDLVINHVTGSVAPVTKTVTYTTVSNVPGEPAKCWITSNLGADHQATSKNDMTEASAGWYWQFNRMQGYKYENYIRTPNTTWIISINESSDWLAVNDPCTIELGSHWRIPTSTEWTNVKTGGNWQNGDGPWNSVLKIHEAGKLEEQSGNLANAGSSGYYWSSKQYDTYNGSYFNIDVYCYMFSYRKWGGYSVRCLWDF